MRILRPLAAAGLAILSLAGCSGSTVVVLNNGDLYVVSCSLGCTNGIGGEQVFCSIVNTHQNQEIAILFSEPINLFTVNTSSFRVINVANGTSPSGQFFLDPLNPRRLIFRPSLTFDDNGNPIFGFEENTTYQITIPGVAQGDNLPFIQSITGRPNQSRLQCTILTSEGIIDPVPGAPKVQMFVTVVTSYDANGDPNGFEYDVPVTKNPELTDVLRSTTIDFEFSDIMNVATLLNPASGQAPFILVEVDDDGTLATLGDRVPVEGKFVFSVDQERLETFLTFTGDLPFPSAGPNAPLSPRRIAVTIPTTVQDLVSNPVLPENGGGTSGMVPEISQFGETIIPGGGEDFADGTNEDARRGGAFWGGGRLAPGLTGGAGQLGDLVVPTGSSVVLNTDSQTFPLTLADGVPVPFIPDILGNPDPTGGGDPGLVDHPDDFPSTVTITDGGFTFTVLQVESGSSLRPEGSQAARLWSRGVSTVEAGGEIDLVGVTPAPIDSMEVLKPDQEIPVEVNAANGADGGFGADRFDMSVNPPMSGLGEPESDARDNPGADIDGRRGQGLGRVGFKGSGPGALHNPGRYPEENFETDPNNNNNHGVTFNISVAGDFGQTDTQCRSLIVGAAGGGAAYATDGGVGHADSTQPTADFPFGAANSPADTPGGDSSEIGLAPPDENNLGYIIRKLQWHLGNLRGAPGGGGGSNHPFGSWATGYDDSNTNDCIGPVASSRFRAWHDHSAAQGGYGAGALHYVSGKKLVINGVIDLRGGNGGAPRGPLPPDPPFVHDFGQYAMPGGGGAGGALRMRSLVIEIADVAGRIDLRGGLGGSGFAGQTKGGDGGTGLLRIEDQAGLVDRASIADDVAPFEPADSSLGWISVAPGELSTTPRERPDSMNGSSSCWLFPPGNFFGLTFVEDQDDPDTGLPELMGWNMEVIWDTGGGEQNEPFRGANSLFMGSFENEFGKLLGYDLDPGETAAPLVVRFQGARAAGNFDRCDLDINDPGAGIVPGSVTPWVDHPALLNEFNPIPNMIRFTIIFDGTVDVPNGDTPGLILPSIKGVTNLQIRALPD